MAFVPAFISTSVGILSLASNMTFISLTYTVCILRELNVERPIVRDVPEVGTEDQSLYSSCYIFLVIDHVLVT